MVTTVLVVDDDDKLRAAMLRTLCARGFDAHGACDAEEAVDILAEKPIEVLVTDLRMPGRDGIDLLGEVRQLSPATRPVLMSAYASAKDHQAATEFGAVAVLCKPFEPDALISAIRQAAECDHGFHGSVHGLSLVDLLQMFHFGRRSVTITLPGVVTGKVHMEAGELVHATRGDRVGVDALRDILSAPTGSLRTGVLETTERSIGQSFDSVLLDAIRMLDEREGGVLDGVEGAFVSWAPPPGEQPVDDLARTREHLQMLVSSAIPEARVWLFDCDSRECASPDDSGERGVLRDTVEGTCKALALLADGWTSMEHLTESSGVGLIRLPGTARVALIAAPLAAQRGKERFRSRFWALVGRLGDDVAAASAGGD